MAYKNSLLNHLSIVHGSEILTIIIIMIIIGVVFYKFVEVFCVWLDCSHRYLLDFFLYLLIFWHCFQSLQLI